MGLADYRRKRNFKATPEPAGTRAGSARRSFVVQLHHASRRHFDFRLEHDGVLKSWAVPKGPSFDPAVKRMAVEVEDHPVSYGSFEGDIPEGNYGAGHVDIFDEGSWVPENDPAEGLEKGELKFELRGDVLRGSWVLVRTRRTGRQQQWLLIKHRDEYAGAKEADDFVDPKTDRPWPKAKRRKAWPEPAAPQRASRLRAAASAQNEGARETLRPEAFAPELCRSQERAPNGEDWLHEIKWDGYRILATVVRGKVQLWSRNAIEWTAKLPGIVAAIRQLGLRSAQLDGELVVVRDGKADFNALQARLSGETGDPLLYLLFDLPHHDGRSLREVPLIERKNRLGNLLDAHPQEALRFSAHQTGHGAAFFAQATKAGLEGIVSKRAGSAYTGTRSGAWVKVKGRPSDEFVVIGYTPPKGARQGIGALLLAKPTGEGLSYVGRVGTGLSNEQLTDLLKRLKRLHVKAPQADLTLLEKKDVAVAQWVRPAMIVEVFFQGIGGQGLLRQPAWKALREDKTLADLAAPEKEVDMKTKPAAKRAAPAKRAASNAKARPAGASPDAFKLTSPERVVFAELGITKADVAAYYEAVAPYLLPGLAGRPVSVVRCPDGAAGQCFFQKHVMRGWGAHIHGVLVQEKKGKQEYLCIDDAAGLLELVQMNVLELHPWGAKSADLDHADRLVFDLDPHSTVGWDAVVAAARDVRAQLTSIGLCSFLRTSGGKGLHVVVPLNPPCPWDQVRQFAQAVSTAMAALRPERYVAVAGEKNRIGKIFIDYLRNGHDATAVASYSLRARPAAGVAMPIAWSELGRVRSGDAFTITNTVQRLRRRKVDPWAEIGGIRQTLPPVAGQKR
ncbi:MAG TPA: DNA ligase D [Tahibacter sp.]|nr:DNA ligase D [Tahibacter sp.]